MIHGMKLFPVITCTLFDNTQKSLTSLIINANLVATNLTATSDIISFTPFSNDRTLGACNSKIITGKPLSFRQILTQKRIFHRRNYKRS